MKKGTKIALIVLVIILVLGVAGVGALMLKGPSDPIVMTEEETKKDQEEQTRIFENVNLAGFKAETVDGKKVTADECFADNKVTMVNIWVTSCGPCIDEMPELAALYKERPDGTNVISVCLDTNENKKDKDFAAKVMKDAKTQFMTLVPDSVLEKELKERTSIYPTTIFVDSEGKIIGAPYFGDHTKDGYKEALEQKLKEAEGNE